MSIDSMRVGGGRCPPLLVGGLLIACIMMVCNWWTLSSTNYELARQIDDLTEELKMSGKERDQCMTQRSEIDKEVKDCKDDARTTHVKLSQVEDAMSTCTKEIESYKRTDLTKTATLEALRLDKKTIEVQLDKQKEENKKLEDEMKQVKDDFEKFKLTINAPQSKQVPALPIARMLEKSQANKTAVNVQLPPQVNAPPNVADAEPQVQDNQDKDNSNMKEDNAAEVNGIDGNNAIDSEINFNLMSDPKAHDMKE